MCPCIKRDSGRHTGKNFAPITLDILQNNGITHKLGSIQIDNAKIAIL